MSILDKRLELIFDRLKSPKFLDSVSLSNDMPYWIFDYDPKDELTIRDYITKKLNPRFEKLEVAFHVINLYDVMLDMLEARQLIDRIPEREIKTGFDGLKKNLDSVLEQKKVAQFIADKYLKSLPKFIVIYGIGSCWPYIRAHAFLSALQAITGATPILLFYPGDYDGREIKPFNILKSEGYYRAFRLVPEKTAVDLTTLMVN